MEHVQLGQFYVENINAFLKRVLEIFTEPVGIAAARLPNNAMELVENVHHFPTITATISSHAMEFASLKDIHGHVMENVSSSQSPAQPVKTLHAQTITLIVTEFAEMDTTLRNAMENVCLQEIIAVIQLVVNK